MAGSDSLRKVRDYIVSMPSLPTTVAKVMEVCNNPRTSPTDLDKVISLDPVLMGKVLKLINSAYYGLQNQVTSLVRAIIMLGVNTVKNLALSTAVLDRLADKSGFRALNMEGFWRHSLGVGVVANLTEKQINAYIDFPRALDRNGSDYLAYVDPLPGVRYRAIEPKRFKVILERKK